MPYAADSAGAGSDGVVANPQLRATVPSMMRGEADWSTPGFAPRDDDLVFETALNGVQACSVVRGWRRRRGSK